MDLGRHHIALTVNDIVASKEFYEKLGFRAEPDYGGVEQGWLIMTNANAIIGLYKGMFPKNIITFNPTDARSIHRELTEKGVTFETVEGIEKESGPCHFIMNDPDGNPVLLDQHF